MALKHIAFGCAAVMAAAGAMAATSSFTVNGQTITKAQQEELIRVYTSRGQERTPQLETQVRHLLTRDMLLLQEARKAKLSERDDVRRMIDNATKNILMSTVINDWLAKNPVKEEEVKALFEKEQKRWGKTEVSVRHILVEDETTAKDLLARVKKGGDFDRIARENSKDTAQNRAMGGLIDWTSPNMFDKEFAESFKNLKPGQIAKKPIKTQLGWHIVKLEGVRPAQRFVNYQAESHALRQLLNQQRVQTYIDDLIKNAKISDLWTRKQKENNFFLRNLSSGACLLRMRAPFLHSTNCLNTGLSTSLDVVVCFKSCISLSAFRTRPPAFDLLPNQVLGG